MCWSEGLVGTTPPASIVKSCSVSPTSTSCRTSPALMTTCFGVKKLVGFSPWASIVTAAGPKLGAAVAAGVVLGGALDADALEQPAIAVAAATKRTNFRTVATSCAPFCAASAAAAVFPACDAVYGRAWVSLRGMRGHSCQHGEDLDR